MDNNKSPRDRAGSFELGTDGSIMGMYSFGEFLEIYTQNKTFRITSPDNIDPHKTNPNTPWVTTPIRDVGSSNPIIARLIMQGDQFIQAAWFENNINKETILKLLHQCTEDLLVCDKIAKKVGVEVKEKILEVESQGIRKEKRAHGLNPFPHISDLNADCEAFLIKSKRTIKSICDLATFFFAIPIKDNNFDNLASSLSSKLKPNCNLINFIVSNAATVKNIIELRNFQEHPSEKKKTVIENFRLTPDIQLIPPQWHITGTSPSFIKEDMEYIVNFLLGIAEEMLMLLVLATVKKEIPYVIVKIEDKEINSDAPIRYKLTIDFSKMPIAK